MRDEAGRRVKVVDAESLHLRNTGRLAGGLKGNRPRHSRFNRGTA